MTIGEFELIDRYFTRPARRAALGIGDDCALLAPRPGHQLAVSSDMLVEGRHFLSTVAPDRLGHKALAVNLSDLAACGARPLAFSLALALPRAEPEFLEGFARGPAGARRCARLRAGRRRHDARPADDLHHGVRRGSGRRGAAALAARAPATTCTSAARSATPGSPSRPFAATSRSRRRTSRSPGRRWSGPQPRIALGVALRGLATSAIDVSDGLLGDLGHILRRSGVGATVDVDALPAGRALAEQPPARRREYTLAGGDDYELVFSAPDSAADAVRRAATLSGVDVTRIGRIEAAAGLRLVDARGEVVADRFGSFDHFQT